MSTILLRNEITPADLNALERWMSNAAVTRYLNEYRQISAHLRAVREARLPVLTPLFNRDGRFWMICAEDAPVGFLRAAYRPDNAAELVVAIGEENMWGAGTRPARRSGGLEARVLRDAARGGRRPHRARQRPLGAAVCRQRLCARPRGRRQHAVPAYAWRVHRPHFIMEKAPRGRGFPAAQWFGLAEPCEKSLARKHGAALERRLH